MKPDMCVLDMDGVIADFTKGICELRQLPYPYHDGNHEALGEWSMAKLWGISDNQFWKGVDADFFENLDPTEEAHDIVRLLEGYFGSRIYILSTPGSKPETMVGKHRWLHKHFPQFTRKRNLLGACKHVCARATSLLVDDGDHNVKDFTEAGGLVHLYARRWNANHPHCDNAFERLESHVKELFS